MKDHYHKKLSPNRLQPRTFLQRPGKWLSFLRQQNRLTEIAAQLTRHHLFTQRKAYEHHDTFIRHNTIHCSDCDACHCNGSNCRSTKPVFGNDKNLRFGVSENPFTRAKRVRHSELSRPHERRQYHLHRSIWKVLQLSWMAQILRRQHYKMGRQFDRLGKLQ